MKTKNILSLIGLVAIFGAIGLLYFIQTSYMKQVKDRGSRTIGVIESVGSNIICRYTIDGADYEYKKSQPFSGLQDGEVYEIAYFPDEKERVVILYESPILPDSIHFNETHSIKVKELWINNGRFQFLYIVDGKTYDRYQKYKNGQKVNGGNSYLVKYNPSNPKIAYLIFEAE